MPTHALQVQQVPLALSNLRIRLPYLLLQFLYGSVFSALFILYFKSASHLTALVWSIGLAGLLIANEFFEHAYRRFTLTWTLFSFCTILLFNFVIPYAIGSVSAIWFFLSVALAVMMTHFLKTAIAEREGKIWPTYALAGVLVVAYIVDVIPPVPLVKRDIQVGTQLEKTALSYRLLQDAAPFGSFGGAQRILCICRLVKQSIAFRPSMRLAVFAIAYIIIGKNTMQHWDGKVCHVLG